MQPAAHTWLYYQFTFAWGWILAGMAAGAVIGLCFHREDWLGGYDSWRRRMLRLGHISFFGTAGINLMFVFSLVLLGANAAGDAAASIESARFKPESVLLICGSVTMPLICYLAAWKTPFRHLFFIPVTCLLLGVGGFLVRGVFQ
jgi:hypothetical protein